jgi:hypothetical protein
MMGRTNMTGTWLPRTGLLCFLGGVVLLLLSCVGLATGEWVWSTFVAAVVLMIVAQILFALSDIVHRLHSLQEAVRNLGKSKESEPGVRR